MEHRPAFDGASSPRRQHSPSRHSRPRSSYNRHQQSNRPHQHQQPFLQQPRQPGTFPQSLPLFPPPSLAPQSSLPDPIPHPRGVAPPSSQQQQPPPQLYQIQLQQLQQRHQQNLEQLQQQQHQQEQKQQYHHHRRQQQQQFQQFCADTTGFPPISYGGRTLGSAAAGGPAPLLLPQGPPQMPPQMFTTAAQLLDLTDKKVILVLRDGRKLVGVLRSWDQFANLLFEHVVERIYSGKLYAEKPQDILVVRGENVTILGEIDMDREEENTDEHEKVEWSTVQALKDEEDALRKKAHSKHSRKLHALGFEPEHSGEVLL